MPSSLIALLLLAAVCRCYDVVVPPRGEMPFVAIMNPGNSFSVVYQITDFDDDFDDGERQVFLQITAPDGRTLHDNLPKGPFSMTAEFNGRYTYKFVNRSFLPAEVSFTASIGNVTPAGSANAMESKLDQLAKTLRSLQETQGVLYQQQQEHITQAKKVSTNVTVWFVSQVSFLALVVTVQTWAIQMMFNGKSK